LVLDVKKDPSTAIISNKLKALLNIAAKVQKGGKNVLGVDIEVAKKEGATDLEIHDTVLIAAAFCMFNRYVDGLDTWAPQDRQFYVDRGPRRAEEGYSHFDLYK
jgi:alkylhydroperoxidase/carboxymuconolactone decarboxylase family protein YurZ